MVRVDNKINEKEIIHQLNLGTSETQHSTSKDSAR